MTRAARAAAAALALRGAAAEATARRAAAGCAATPVVRALAREHGIDINRIRGSGPAGRVEKQDVLAAAEPDEPRGEPCRPIDERSPPA